MVNQPTYNPNDRSQFRPSVIAIVRSPISSSPVRASSRSLSRRPSKAVSTGHPASSIRRRVHRRWPQEDRGYAQPRPRQPDDDSRALVNVGITKLAMTLQPDQLWDTMTHFGLGELTTSGFPGESAGMLTHFSNWRPISQATLAYGYGISVTPLQLAQAYAAIGDDGNMRPISLVALDQPNEGEQVIGADTALPCAACSKKLCDRAAPGPRLPSTVIASRERPARPGNLHRRLLEGQVHFDFRGPCARRVIRAWRRSLSSMSRAVSSTTEAMLPRRCLPTSCRSRCVCWPFHPMPCRPRSRQRHAGNGNAPESQ